MPSLAVNQDGNMSVAAGAEQKRRGRVDGGAGGVGAKEGGEGAVKEEDE